jgi:hypothetical protein
VRPYDLAKFTRQPTAAAKQLAADDDAASHAAFDQQESHGFGLGRHVDIGLGDAEGIGVVFHGDGKIVADLLDQQLAQRNILPA